ncbi:uncharacterized protein LY89DRAFT_357804 [Mollisia scopiformis]|uniref:DUF7730 domain-containing protein n=1 Tax=Mollisia scopiformis TaxID=149040 RepID=A0A132B580_MOLSC|nr:uncharacterized protein LY89DRAFT_357804 [Mollisia scopiformis]KUJ07568.1 hypothetical protein LY89DRAFT_357804 [Mollisia scopiformis]
MADESPFMRIPSEIRLMIYELLFIDNSQRVFQIRNQDPETYKNQPHHQRTGYRIIGRDLVRQSTPTTYTLVNDVELHTSIMRVNRKVYTETAHMLYSNRTFDFGRDIEAIVPFFSDLSKHTRPFIQEISLVKQGSVYSRDYDRCEWSGVCDFMREYMRVESLNLTVEGGRPSLGYAGLPEYSVQDFKTLESVAYEPLEWVWQLLSVKGIKKLEIESEIHHCPPSHSSAMAFFAAFSASIETGFADFLREELIGLQAITRAFQDS